MKKKRRTSSKTNEKLEMTTRNPTGKKPKTSQKKTTSTSTSSSRRTHDTHADTEIDAPSYKRKSQNKSKKIEPENVPKNPHPSVNDDSDVSPNATQKKVSEHPEKTVDPSSASNTRDADGGNLTMPLLRAFVPKSKTKISRRLLKIPKPKGVIFDTLLLSSPIRSVTGEADELDFLS